MTASATHRHIYALLVGIDDYIGRVPPLKGCVNDIRRIETYLSDRVDSQAYQLHIHKLLNAQATRQAVIDGFRNHLMQAGSNDIALFYYSGHGSQEAAPEEFWPMEPDRMNETLVCWDSREAGGRDLADKELGYLIEQLSQQHPQVVMIMDCCHSGSGTREIIPEGVRHSPADFRQRNLQDFIFSADEAYLSRLLATPPGDDLPEVGDRQSGWSLPVGRHILLAGCHDSELASEYLGDGEERGAFSYFLVDTLEKTRGSLSYRDLFKRASSLVRGRIKDQSPQLEATHPQDLELPFLGNSEAAAIAPRPPYYTLSCSGPGQWIIDGGAVHGLPQAGAEPMILALYPQGAPAADLERPAAAIGEIQVLEVFSSYSRVGFTQEPEGLTPETVLNAVVISLPIQPLAVCLEGDAAAIALIEPDLSRSLYLQRVDSPAQAKLRVAVADNRWRITQPRDERTLVDPIVGLSPEQVTQVVQRLEHMARWTTILELASAGTGSLPSNAVQMQLYHQGKAVNDAVVRLEYEGDQNPTFQLKITNQTDQRLYCALLDLTEEYSVSAPFFAAGGEWIDPQTEIFATAILRGQRTDQIPTSLPKRLWEQGVTEYQDVLKLIVSTTEFDPRLLAQDKLDRPPPEPTRSLGTSSRRSLNRLMKRVTTRGIADEEELEQVDSWVTSQLTLVTVRPQPQVTVSPQSRQSLGHEVTLEAPPQFQAQARLVSVAQASRDVGHPPLPPLLREGSQPFQFRSSRGVDPGLSTLELTQVHHPEAVTPDHPLKLAVPGTLAEDEQILPVAFDGEFYLPLGLGFHREGKTEIELQRLPAPTPNRRSVGGAIQIYFQKVLRRQLGQDLSQILGVKFDYPILAVAEVAQRAVSYLPERAVVEQRVAQADSIVLFIHGIFGDTRSMVPSVETTQVEHDGQIQTLNELYDLVLTYDYESINTSIRDHAAALKRRLREVGLGEDHGKTLHIVAHSMGGLVSRHFIEALGGNQVVQHLILLGTPNAGSPWPEVQRGITIAMALLLNGLSTVVMPLNILGALLQRLEKIDVTLDEMEPGSEFLEGLWMNEDPQTPYSVVVGNTHLIPGDTSATLPERLLRKLFKAVELPFGGQPNDIAVSVESIQGLPEHRVPQPVFEEVACNHLVYFTDPAGLTGLGHAVARAFQGATPDSPPPEASPADPEDLNFESLPSSFEEAMAAVNVAAQPSTVSAPRSLDAIESPVGLANRMDQSKRQEDLMVRVAIGLITAAVVLLGFAAWRKFDRQQSAPQGSSSAAPAQYKTASHPAIAALAPDSSKLPSSHQAAI
ncbi:caspase family protein [Lyngbya confervoides]|uniref:Caspase family protein n=1 Tax=Lyngbya confervoides BDU141951 TaxID=1574623 RepID=A0ABD4T227_9CYAN|nr:caspase family protein [Lyngbya confervoides]MCM1982627.1 caspase family protein [Lyngbya confervoides BDU141951]